MKRSPVLALTGFLIVLILCCGCTQEQEAAVPTAAPTLPETTAPVVPAVTANPYPNASATGTAVPFGTGDMTGTVAVTRYDEKPVYTWTSPSWRSARQQAAYAPANDVQTGYNTETPAEGNTFLFVFIRVACTGTKAVYAPSPRQFAVYANGTTYQYRTVEDSEVTIEGITGTQYDYLLGNGGTGGYVQPGASNAVAGYLIYEIPAGISADRIFVVANPDYQTQAEWKLA